MESPLHLPGPLALFVNAGLVEPMGWRAGIQRPFSEARLPHPREIVVPEAETQKKTVFGYLGGLFPPISPGI